jgi:hypothetical protein
VVAIVVVVSAVVAGGTNAAVQYAQTGSVSNWFGNGGVFMAAGIGAAAGAVGCGVGALAGAGAVAVLGSSTWAGIGAGAFGGAAGGAAAGATGSLLSGGNATQVGNAMLLGTISGAVGGSVGVAAGSQSANGLVAFGAQLLGTGAGTGAGLGAGALMGQETTWASAGMAFGTAFAGTMATAALSAGMKAATESNTAGNAAAGSRAKSASASSSGSMPDARLPAVPTLDPDELQGTLYSISRAMGEGRNQLAVTTAAHYWKVEGLAQPVSYVGTSSMEPELAGLTTLSESGAVDVAIYDPGMRSPEELLSTMYHEGRVHAVQARTPGQWASSSDRWGNAVNECEAYGAEIALSRQLGLSTAKVSGLQGLYTQWFNQVAGTGFEPRVRAGNYSLTPRPR